MTTRTFASYSAAPYRDEQVQVTAFAEDTADDPLGLAASESAAFPWLQDEQAAAFLIGRGCDPIQARLMVEVAARGYHAIEIFPAEGRVDVRGDHKYHRNRGEF